MRFCYIPDFDRSVKNLLAKAKFGYTSLKVDLKDLFSNQDFPSLWEFRDMILDQDRFRLIKTRMKNGHQKLSKRDGYRVFFMLDRQEETCTFIDVFPKAGKFARVILTEKEIETLVKHYVSESEQGLKEYEF